MARVRFRLPDLLADLLGGERSVDVEADTLRGALDALIAERGSIGVHLFDEAGAFREHVLCFLNGTNTRWMDDLDHSVADGDEVTILQAVSGG